MTDTALRFSDNLESRVEFDKLIAELSARFINLAPGDVDVEIAAALRRVCERLGLDLAVLWQWASEGAIVPTHVYARDGLQAPGPLLPEQFPWYREQMLAGRVVAAPSLEALRERPPWTANPAASSA